MMQKQEIRELIERHLQGHLGEDGQQQLADCIGRHEATVMEVLEQMQEEEPSYIAPLDADRMSQTLQNILATDKTVQAPVVALNNRATRRWLWAAASIIIVIGIGLGVYRLLNNHPANQPQKTVAVADIKAPDANRAMITLADGRSVYLDSLNNGQVAMQGGVRVVKLENGKVAYESGSSDGSKTIAYNTLTNPRGSKVINIQLADGTHVWLNAESSVTYPVAFTGNERKVTMTGEAYFEVAHDASKPFFVKAGDMEVQVLGTHFNVNAYTDEDAVRATLLQGSVKVNVGKQSIMIKPGQQAKLESSDDNLQTVSDVDIEDVMAWKNGNFSFHSASISTILRQASRWYDIDIAYDGKIAETFSGGMPRSANIQQLLNILEATGKVEFSVVGKQIIVKPK